MKRQSVAMLTLNSNSSLKAAWFGTPNFKEDNKPQSTNVPNLRPGKHVWNSFFPTPSSLRDAAELSIYVSGLPTEDGCTMRRCTCSKATQMTRKMLERCATCYCFHLQNDGQSFLDQRPDDIWLFLAIEVHTQVELPPDLGKSFDVHFLLLHSLRLSGAIQWIWNHSQ